VLKRCFSVNSKPSQKKYKELYDINGDYFFSLTDKEENIYSFSFFEKDRKLLENIFTIIDSGQHKISLKKYISFYREFRTFKTSINFLKS
jgi:hypothetical protein